MLRSNSCFENFWRLPNELHVAEFFQNLPGSFLGKPAWMSYSLVNILVLGSVKMNSTVALSQQISAIQTES